MSQLIKPSLKVLSLNGLDKLDDLVVYDIAKKCPNLEKLELGNCFGIRVGINDFAL